MSRSVVAPLSSAIIAVLLAGVVVVGVDRSGIDVRPGEALLDVKGVVEVAVGGRDFVRLEGTPSRILSQTDRIRVVEGLARLELPGGASAELRRGSAVAIADGNDASLILESGDLLVQAPQDTVEVDGGTAVVSVVGAAKLRRNASLVAGVYDGNVLMVRDRNRFQVPRYRQAAVVGTGLLPDTAAPLSLSSSDIWDLRLLPEVLNLDHQLKLLGENFESTLPAGMDAGRDVFAAVVPGIAGSITPSLLAGRAPGENLIGLILVALDQEGDFVTRVQRVFGFRSAGASWGLVAADRNLKPFPVINQLESALAALRSDGAGGELAAGIGERLGAVIGRARNGGANGGGEVAAPPGPAPAGPDTPGGTPPGGGTEPGTPGGTPGGQPPPSGGTPPAPPPPPEKRLDLPPTGTFLDPVLEPVVDPLENLLSGVLDTLLGPQTVSEPANTPTTTTTTTTTTDGSGGLLGGLTGSVGSLLGG